MPRLVTPVFLVVALLCRPLAAEDHWSFRPVTRPAVPQSTTAAEPATNPVDAFIRHRLNRERLSASPAADPATLIRRVTLDLIGLPPAPDEVIAFLDDSRPDAYERLVDRLIASPHYGERWARPWLDLCHYGDSDGHLTDQLRPVAWRYRDWVVRMLNDNLPFDEFTVRQLAGDLLGQSSAGRSRTPQQLDQILGTGFLRQTLSNREGGADLEEFRVAQVVDRTSMAGATWLGLTVGCARCHDHKYDPLTQEEYFQIYACFDSADEVNIDAPLPGEAADYPASRAEYERQRQAAIAPYQPGLSELQRRWEVRCLRAAEHPGEDHVWDRQWELLGLIWGGNLGEGQLEGCEIVRRPWNDRTVRQQDDLLDYFLARGSVIDERRYAELKLAELQKRLAALKAEFPKAFVTRAPVVQAAFSPRRTYIHDRGDFRSRGPDVAPAVRRWLAARAEPAIRSGGATAPRLALARWLTSPDHPLTARVTVNRMWQEFFGRGLVATPDDFGTRGARPSHPDLLDWLASEFVGGGWDVKRMHRLIVRSATYRQSSLPRSDLSQRDPDNMLLARQSSLRIPAEAVRDAALAVSGLLSDTLGGPSVYPPQHERVTMEAFGSNVWKASAGENRYRRGLYTFIQRTSPFAQSIVFDAPVPLEICARRDRSNSPLQALTLLNDPVFGEMAAALGNRILEESGPTDEARLRFAIPLCLARQPRDIEVVRLKRFLHATAGQPESRRWQDLASVLLNLHEFITRD